MSKTGIPWLDVAAGELGVREIPGTDSNPRIGEYFSATWAGQSTRDHVPWCAAFVCWCLRESGHLHDLGGVGARWFAHWGKPGAWSLGDVVGWVDPRSGRGHVGFLVGQAATRIWLLGGNQGNQVSVNSYARAERDLFCRRPRGHDLQGPVGPYRSELLGDVVATNDERTR